MNHGIETLTAAAAALAGAVTGIVAGLTLNKQKLADAEAQVLALTQQLATAQAAALSADDAAALDAAVQSITQSTQQLIAAAG